MDQSVVPRHGPVVNGMSRFFMRLWKVLLFILPVLRIGNNARYRFWKKARAICYYAPELLGSLASTVTVVLVVIMYHTQPAFMESWTDGGRLSFLIGGMIYGCILGTKVYLLCVPYINRWSDFCLDLEIKNLP